MASTHPYYQVFYTAVIWIIMQRSSTSGEERCMMIKLTAAQGTILALSGFAKKSLSSHWY